nr:alpha/beta hydrolase [Pseudonocardia humida]
MHAESFAPLADLLAADHTVVTTDPRGMKRSPLDDPDQDSTELRADDLVRLIAHVDAGPAAVFASSGGAVTALALVQPEPGRRARCRSRRLCSAAGASCGPRASGAASPRSRMRTSWSGPSHNAYGRSGAGWSSVVQTPTRPRPHRRRLVGLRRAGAHGKPLGPARLATGPDCLLLVPRFHRPPRGAKTGEPLPTGRGRRALRSRRRRRAAHDSGKGCIR